MKVKIVFPIFAVLMMSSGLFGCKTTEKNYREAYEKVMHKRNEGVDSAQAAAMQLENSVPVSDAGDGIRLPMKSEFVMITPDGGGLRESLKKFSVVVGVFRQKFNALSMRERLIDNGYPGAFVVNTSAKEYYVIASSSDSPAEARDILEKASSDSGMVLRSPLPWVLRRPR